MARSAELLEQIERHRAAYGRYPPSLVAVWKDFSPGVVGIDRYRYAPQEPGYDLVFEQPRLLFDNVGTREFVVYNRWDRHRIPSHAAWILEWSEDVLATRQGWYAAHSAPRPHWKYSWFD